MTTVKMVKLGTLIKPAKLQKCGNDDYPVLSMTMHNGLVFQSDKFKKSVASQDKSTYKVVHRNQLVIGFPIDEGVLATQRITDAGIVSPAYGIWDVDQTKIIPEFLEYALRCNRAIDYYKAKLRGSTARRRSLPTPTLLELDVPLPDIEQQKLALTTIHHAKNALDSRQAQLTKLDELVKARFVEMFGNFVYELDRWSTCEIGDVADTIDPQPSHRTPPVSLDGIPYIGIAECNYQTRKIAFKSARKVGKDVLKEHKNRYTLNDGDFIIGKIGTIGKPFFLPTDCDYTLSANTVLIKPQKDKINPRFLFAIFESEYMDRIIDAEKKSTSQPAFGIQKVRSIEIPLPPLSLQNQFAAFVEEVDKSKVEVQKALDQTQLLFDSLMQQYFG